jgi:plasmid stability protein
MSNLTIALDDNIVKQARLRAVQEGTSISAKIREFLAQYAQGTASASAPGDAFLAFAAQSTANADGADWRRNDAYDRAYPAK